MVVVRLTRRARTLATGLQRLGVRLEVTEAVLNHLSGSRAGVVGIYQRHDWAEEKRTALDAWCVHLLAASENSGHASWRKGDAVQSSDSRINIALRNFMKFPLIPVRYPFNPTTFKIKCYRHLHEAFNSWICINVFDPFDSHDCLEEL